MYAKFEDLSGNTVYGRIDRWSKAAKREEEQGNVLLDDDKGVTHCVSAEKVTHIADGEFKKLGEDERGNAIMGFDDEYHRHMIEEYRKARERSAANPDDGILRVGDMFALSVADGYAYYIVERIEGGEANMSWRAFDGDAWVDRHFGYGGWFDATEVYRYVKWDKGLTKIFGEKG